MKIDNLVQWFLVNVLGRKPAPVESRVFPSLLEGGDAVCCDDDTMDAFMTVCREDTESHLSEVAKLVSAKTPKVSKKNKKTNKSKTKSVKVKKPVWKTAKK